MGWWKDLQQRFAEWPDMALSAALLVAAAIIIGIALTPGNRLVKAIVLAYIILP